MTSDGAERADDRVRGASTSVSRLLLSGGAWSLASRFGQSFVMLGGTVILARLLDDQAKPLPVKNQGTAS